MTREEIINEYLKEHRHDVLLNPYAGLLDFAKYLDEHSELPEGLDTLLEDGAEMFNTEDAARMWDYEGKTEGEIVKAAYIKGGYAGAEWQKEKDTRDMYMSDNRHFQKVYELGKKEMKEEMMEKAVEGVVQDDGQFINFGDGRYIDLDPTMENKPVFELTDGEKVRVIVIKEEK